METVNIFKQDIRNKIKVDVPFIPGAWVEFYDDITVAAVEQAQLADKSKDFDASLSVLLNQIAAWNFADNNGVLEITLDNIKKLPVKLLTYLGQQQQSLLEQELSDKKKVSSES